LGDAWKTFRPIRCENWGIDVSVRAKLGEGLGSYPGLRPGSGPSGVLDRVGVQKREEIRVVGQAGKLDVVIRNRRGKISIAGLYKPFPLKNWVLALFNGFPFSYLDLPI
jgi:hypothetical protein